EVAQEYQSHCRYGDLQVAEHRDVGCVSHQIPDPQVGQLADEAAAALGPSDVQRAEAGGDRARHLQVAAGQHAVFVEADEVVVEDEGDVVPGAVRDRGRIRGLVGGTTPTDAELL